MKKAILACLTALLLLAGCGGEPQATLPSVTESTVAETAVPQGYYRPGSEQEQQTDGAVRVYPLDIPRCEGIAVLGENLLLFSGTDSGTRLTLLSGDTLYCAAVRDADVHIDPLAPSTQVTAQGVSYFDSAAGETVLLDENLREILRISPPEEICGAPMLSADRRTLYYGTGNSIRALDLDTQIPRTVRQLSGQTGEIVGLIRDDSILLCRISGGEGAAVTQFLSTETGQLVTSRQDITAIVSSGTHYQAFLTADGLPTLVFGSGDAPPQTLNSLSRGDVLQLPHSRAVLELTGVSPLCLNCYDLTTGLRRSCLQLEEDGLTAAADGGNGIVWLLTGNADAATLYRWDTGSLPTGDETVYTGTYYTRSNPDLAGIAQCQALAEEISLRHGVEVLIWEDAIAVQPWDYHLTEEYLVPLLTQQLTLLDRRLAHFPEGFLSTLSSSFRGLTICLVRQLQGYSGGDTLDTASGLQFWVEDHAYIALSTIAATEGSLYHELCHVMDTRVFAHSNAYDQWEALNPSGFAYDYDYAANAGRNAGEYLRDAERCFIDTYSMSFPKEDRARILEYAMTEGNESYFQSKTMQSKLRQICIGLREAFGLKKSPETFLWEQYLQESLAYTK